MSRVPLSTEENRAIFTESFGDALRDLDRDDQVQTLKKIHKLLDSTYPEHYIYKNAKGCEELQIIRISDSLRIYCRLVMGIPHDNKAYNVLFLFYISKHEYRDAVMQRFDKRAQERLENITNLDAVDDVETYLAEHDAKDAAFLQERLDRA